MFPKGLKYLLLRSFLILCVGLAPVLDGIASDVGNMHRHAIDCPTCEKVDTGMASACDNPVCMLAASACGNGASAPLIVHALNLKGRLLIGLGARDAYLTRFRSRYAFSIYRPPIT